MSISRTWVLCASASRAKLYRLDISLNGITCVYEVAAKEDFTKVLAEEVEFTCGSGSNDRILICGQFPLLSRICQSLSDSARSRILGLIPRDLTTSSDEGVRVIAERAALRKSA